jgi:hypothetical protein
LACGGQFEDKATASGMTFTQPAGYQIVSPQENRDVKYDYAVRHATEKYEIRYSVQPIAKDPELQQSSASSDKNANITTDPNQMFEAKFRVMAANIAGKADNVGPMEHFPAEAAKKEFGADDGMVVPMEVGSDFGKGFKACMLVGIHKKDVADAFIFYLFDDPEQMRRGQRDVFYALKFTDDKK